ncbi:MAG: hypothetical protein E4G98_03995 [Promethearchaeota archaeon]|nr:MAG: hypothetical protein E4G98_03995 [Candidatus Lokiarchaeota archaeon]
MKSKPNQTVRATTRAEQMKGVFNFISVIHKYRIFRAFLLLSPRILYSVGHLLGHFLVAKPRLQAYMLPGIDFLFGNHLSVIKKKKIFEANAKFMASMVLDAMFYSPNIYTHTLNKFISFTNIHYLDEILERGKGAIVVGTHVSMYFHIIAGLVYHPHHYNVLVVNKGRNQVMYENILARPGLNNLAVINQKDFKIERDSIIKHLENNGIMIILYDYSKKHQLQVPFWDKHLPQLITSPQSAIRLHKVTGAGIVPVLISPRGIIGRSEVQFLDPSPIEQLSLKFWNDSTKLHGELSITLNALFAPHLRKYVVVWEELRKLSIRLSDSVEFDISLLIKECIARCEEKCYLILSSSYERGRKNIFIQDQLRLIFQQLSKLPDHILGKLMYTKSIDLSYSTSLQKLQKILTAVRELIEPFDGVDLSIIKIERCKENIAQHFFQ